MKNRVSKIIPIILHIMEYIWLQILPFSIQIVILNPSSQWVTVYGFKKSNRVSNAKYHNLN